MTSEQSRDGSDAPLSDDAQPSDGAVLTAQPSGPGDRPTVPLSNRENLLLSIAAMFTIMVVLGFASGSPDVGALFVRKVPLRTPVHRPLPDLCTVFAGGSAAGPVLKPDPDSREMDRNAVACRFTASRGSRSLHPSVRLSAARPDPAFLDLSGGDELTASRRDFRLYAADGLLHDASKRTVQGLGDEALVASTSDDEETEAQLVVRSGVLRVEVSYREARYGEGLRPVSPQQAEQTAQVLAAELLKRIPRD